MNYTQTLEFLFNSLPVFETQGATAYKPGFSVVASNQIFPHFRPAPRLGDSGGATLPVEM